MVLTIRTDNPQAEIGLFYNTGQKRQYKKWQAHRQLAESIHKEIDQMFKHEEISWNKITGIVCFQGPGSFTGLRIGITIANTLAYSLQVAIVGSTGNDWASNGIKKIADGVNKKIIIPTYGNEPHITQQKK